MARKIHSQPRVVGVTRIPRATSILPTLDTWVQNEARRYRVSKAFVLANCVSFASAIPMVSYREVGTKIKLVHGRRHAR